MPLRAQQPRTQLKVDRPKENGVGVCASGTWMLQSVRVRQPPQARARVRAQLQVQVQFQAQASLARARLTSSASRPASTTGRQARESPGHLARRHPRARAGTLARGSSRSWTFCAEDPRRPRRLQGCESADGRALVAPTGGRRAMRYSSASAGWLSGADCRTVGRGGPRASRQCNRPLPRASLRADQMRQRAATTRALLTRAVGPLAARGSCMEALPRPRGCARSAGT